MAKSTSKLFQSEEPKTMKEDAMNLPAEVVDDEPKVVNQTDDKRVEDDIQDIDISAIKKKKFRINGDPKKVIELNTSDMNITQRLTVSYDRLLKYVDAVSDVLSKLPENEEELTTEQGNFIQEKLDEIDNKMRDELDSIFNAPVSEACSDGGSMYDPFDGMFRFEHIIEALAKLYETNISSEFSKLRRRVSAKTSKYTKKYHN